MINLYSLSKFLKQNHFQLRNMLAAIANCAVENERGRSVNDRTIEDNAQETVSFSFILFNQPLVGKELIMTA